MKGRSPAAGAFLPTLTPTLHGVFADPDGGTGQVAFEVWNQAMTVMITSGLGSTVASGLDSAWTVPAAVLVNGTKYEWRARGYDGTAYGAYTTFKGFTPDVTAPAAPSVSSTQYPSGTWSGSSSTQGTFTWSSSSTDVAVYYYDFDHNPPTQATTDTSVMFTPADGPHHLRVQAVDKAGNRSSVTDYAFNVGEGGVTAPTTGARTAARVNLAAVTKTTYTQVTFQYRHTNNDTWATIPAADVTNGGAAVTWPLSYTNGATPTLVWNVASTLGFADGPVQVRASLAGGASATTDGRDLTLDQNAFGGAYATESVGPGLVSLLTGNFLLSATDVSIWAWASDLTIGRVYNSRSPNAGSSGPFGSGWVADLPTDAAKAAWRQLDDNGDYVIVTAADGGIVTFTNKVTSSTKTTYTPEAAATGLSLTSDATTANPTPTEFKLKDLTGEKTTFTMQGSEWLPSKVVQASGSETSYTFDTTVSPARITRVLAPKPGTVSGTCATITAGCRALNLTYATSTTATGTDEANWGDYTGRLKSVTFTAYDPAQSAVTTTQVERYLYDSNGRLRAAWDPRITPALKTRYGYDDAGHITLVTPPGESAWTISYAALSGETNTGRLRQVSRPALPSGTATTTVTYRVPPSGSSGGMTAPYPMAAGDVADWAQTDVPTDATAVFPPDQVPSDPTAPSSFSRATVFYMDVNGRLVNTARPGGHIETTEYDSHGNNIRTLTAANRACAVSSTCSVPSGATSHPTKATELDSHSIYAPDGVEELESFGPTHMVTLASGEQIPARAHTVTTYDQGAPSGGPYHLPTTVKVGAWQIGQASDADVRTSTLGYDDPTKATTDPDYHVGWTLHQVITSTVDAVSGGLNLKTVTLYNPTTGLVTEERLPGTGATPDARRTKYFYYTGDASSGDPACNSKPQFANLLCKRAPAAQPGTPGMPNIPSWTYNYNLYNQVLTETGAVGTATNTTTATYDAAGRLSDLSVTSSGGTTDLPAAHTSYDPATGRPTTTSVTEAGVTSTITRSYDALGRLDGYQDADGNSATFGYDLLDRLTSVNDGKGTATFTYDIAIDPRGLHTSMADSAAGTFTARYDADGRMTIKGYPNGMEARTTYNPAGEPTELKYVKTTNCSSNCTWLDFQAAYSIHGQWASQTSNLSSQAFTYDAAARLTEVQDTPAGTAGCTIRTYGYDADSNRTSLNAKNPAADGSCNTGAAGTTVTHTYDAADRITDAGFVYGRFGQITTVPAAAAGTAGDLTMAYFANSMVRSLSLGGTTETWKLDPERRLRTRTDSGGQTGTKTFHYSSDADSPSWIAENASGSSWTRNILGPDGTLAAVQNSSTGTTLQLANLHGDIVATASTSTTATGPTSTFEASEFGMPRTSPTQRYGWLGAEQRETDVLTKTMLMGVRLYTPTLGRFLQVDPVVGGSANAYDYANQDPVNQFDLTGAYTYGTWLLQWSTSSYTSWYTYATSKLGTRFQRQWKYQSRLWRRSINEYVHIIGFQYRRWREEFVRFRRCYLFYCWGYTPFYLTWREQYIWTVWR